jgi:general stress protein YciG
MVETTVNKGRFQKGDPRTKEAASKGGKAGGAVSPTNFKNNPELASKAGKAGGKKSRRKKVSNGKS